MDLNFVKVAHAVSVAVTLASCSKNDFRDWTLLERLYLLSMPTRVALKRDPSPSTAYTMMVKRVCIGQM